MGLKKDRIRELAQDFFVQNLDATQEEIAEMYGVTGKTISEWKRKHDWEAKRRDYHSSPVKIKQLLQDELLRVAQGETPKLSADGISKLMAALDRCEKKLDPNVVAKLLKELDNFISKVNPAFAVECTQYHKQFLLNRISLEA